MNNALVEQLKQFLIREIDLRVSIIQHFGGHEKAFLGFMTDPIEGTFNDPYLGKTEFLYVEEAKEANRQIRDMIHVDENVKDPMDIYSAWIEYRKLNPIQGEGK